MCSLFTAPSLVLAWLAIRSIRDQQFLLERQQSLLYQNVTDTLAQNISDRLAQKQQEFSAQVEALAATNRPNIMALQFDNQIRQFWPLADVGFSVLLSGTAGSTLTCPGPNAGPTAQRFLADNGGFLGNSEAAEVYWNVNNSKLGVQKNASGGDNASIVQNSLNNSQAPQAQSKSDLSQYAANSAEANGQNFALTKSKARSVNPQNGNSSKPLPMPRPIRKKGISPKSSPPKPSSANSSATAPTACSRVFCRTNSSSCSGIA